MLDAVREVSEASGDSYGSRRMKHALNALGYPVGRWKARRLMREAGVFARYRKKYKVTTNSNHKQPVFENILDRQFSVSGPDQAYVSDITYVWTQEGWLYLAMVIDLFSRRVVGWSMSSRMKACLVTDALRMAIWQRRPPPGLIVHPVREQSLPATIEEAWFCWQHEPEGRLLGQQCGRKLLRQFEEGTYPMV